MSKLERVARALAAHSLDLNGNDAPVDYSAIIDRIWPRFVGQARAAIETSDRFDAMLSAALPTKDK